MTDVDDKCHFSPGPLVQYLSVSSFRSVNQDTDGGI
jgi:hypothetical protein